MAEEKENGSKGGNIRISKDTLYGLIIVGLAALIVLSILTQGFGLVSSPNTTTTVNLQQTTTNNTNSTAPSFPQLSINVGNLPVLGQSTAPVTVVEFSDFQCPFCQSLYSDAEAQIRSNYVNSGKVKLYFRDFPLTSIHPDAMAGAIAARCANDQGMFWQMHDTLYTNQNAWSSQTDPTATLEQYAANLSLNTATFDSCLQSQTHISEIDADETQGQTYGVQGTPGVFVIIPKNKISLQDLQGAVTNGITINQDSSNYVIFVQGAYPYSNFDAILSKVSY